ncbi:hypothetical protein ACFL5V_01005 [Fibrobacterota bacterium]
MSGRVTRLIQAFGLLLLLPSHALAEAGFISNLECYSRGRPVPAGISGRMAFKQRLRIRLNQKLLLENRDYEFSDPDQSFKLAFSLNPGDSLCLELFNSPIISAPTYRLYRLEDVPVFKKGGLPERKEVQVASQAGAGEGRVPAYRLDYGGNKSLLVTVGGEGGVNLEQSLQLDIKGRLSENVFIMGHLSDQEIPIQPEGNTATLREVDQIYMKVYGREYSYTLGDYLFSFGEPGVDNYVANVQGMMAHYARGQYGGKVSLSRTRGQYHTYTFFGEFGKQTDYFLRGKNGEQFITVLAGTERVWRNGERLRRGKHYQIEYGEGRIDFLTPVVVSGDEQYTVEFQYTRQDYPSFLYSGGLADTLGRFTWSLRAITERDSRDNPDAFMLSDVDREYLSGIGDNESEARTRGFSHPYQDSLWIAGLYAWDQDRFAYVDSAVFDSLRATAVPMYSVNFFPSDTGTYAEVAPGSRYRYTASPDSGGFSPGTDITLPASRAHYALGIRYQDTTGKETGHASSLVLMGSALDKNLFSDLEDSDNDGYGLKYAGSQRLGRPVDEGGWGRVGLKFLNDMKSRDYRSFRQLVEPYQFREIWNITAGYGEKDYTSNRFILEEELFRGVTFGSEYGYFQGNGNGIGGDGANSERVKGFSSIGRVDRGLDAFTESKHANITRDGRHQVRDNYKSGLTGAWMLGKFLPRASFMQDEWIDRRPGAPLARSMKREGNAGFETRPLFKKMLLTASAQVLRWNSNFTGDAAVYTDSLHSWEVSQKTELFDIGPWQTDLFLSYQEVKQRDSLRSELGENTFKLAEWNNRLHDRKGSFSLISSYRINQKVDYPLIDYYQKVPEGTGTHSCDTLTDQAGRQRDWCVEDEKGDREFLGQRRDSIGIGLQDVNLNGNLSLSPGKLPLKQQGLLNDIKIYLEFILAHQDDSRNPGMGPLFTDNQIEQVLGGRARYQPSVRWTNAGGDKTWHVIYEREFQKTYSFPVYKHLLVGERSTFRHEITATLNYTLRQNVSDRRRTSGEEQLNSNVLASGFGGEVEKKLRGDWLVRPITDYSRSEGTEAISGGTTESAFVLQSLYPKLWLEKGVFRRGRVYVEYGLNYIWGEGQRNEIFKYNGFDKGLTHRVQAGMDFQVGQYVYGNGNYLLRKEPQSDRLFQKLTAEIQAVF